jgi:chromosome partitioning protein
LKDIVAGIKGYEYIVIDCPPSLGLLTINALAAANNLLVPMQCEFYSLEGLSNLLRTVNLIQKNINKDLFISGILLTMYDKRNKLTEHVETDVRNCLGNLVFRTIIPRNVRVSEAPSHGVPVVIYDCKSTGAMKYMELVEEILNNRRLQCQLAEV